MRSRRSEAKMGEAKRGGGRGVKEGDGGGEATEKRWTEGGESERAGAERAPAE